MPRVDPRRLGPPKEGCGASHSPRKEGKNPTGWSNTPPTHGDVLIDVTAPSTDKTEEMDWTDPSSVVFANKARKEKQ
ncbi:hypothetical protein Pcinc_004293 [Petrolisthes cinctipes]|uniref:Uncharacterized protein n=1 Tax=Petrolisthes cinctipes TaxID=88211 RepID=A0AAE1GER3_PETCI|nr:hypothetical protein Pcinc_004293 [Petrolisthes cinctipes]